MIHMGEKGTRYTNQFKEQILKLHEMGKKVYELSSEYGVSTVTIYKWIKESKPVLLPDGEVTTKEYNRLQKEIEQLKMENEILKKATAIFARKHPDI